MSGSDNGWTAGRPGVPEEPVRRVDDGGPTMTTTWLYAAEVIALALEHGTPEGKRLAREELRHMARAADAARSAR
jgi:hypothetical protein